MRTSTAFRDESANDPTWMEPQIGTEFQRRVFSCLSLEISLNLLGDSWQHLMLHADCTWSQRTWVGHTKRPSQSHTSVLQALLHLSSRCLSQRSTSQIFCRSVTLHHRVLFLLWPLKVQTTYYPVKKKNQPKPRNKNLIYFRSLDPCSTYSWKPLISF